VKPVGRKSLEVMPRIRSSKSVVPELDWTNQIWPLKSAWMPMSHVVGKNVAEYCG
jgi:hypothetical protein